MMNGRLILLIFILFCVNASSAAEFSSLEEEMSGAEFQQSGLDKLSADELRYLNQWLGRQSVVAPEPARAAAAMEEEMGFPKPAPKRVVIESAIDGEFTGWTGRTRFQLTNGQVWEQVQGGSVYYRSDSPSVRIEPKSLGSWKMYIEGLGRSVKVKRVK